MDNKAFFKLTYGLFVTGVEWEGKLNGCIINTASQATSDPAVITATMLKTNLTTELILKKRSMTVSVIGLDCPLDTVKHFGMASGRDTEKYASDCTRDSAGNPYITEGMIARFECDVTDAVELSTHWLFILTVRDAHVLSNSAPMTYADYRALKSKPAEKKWVCTVCHYVYDGETPFEQLPSDWVCPVCGVGKELFISE